MMKVRMTVFISLTRVEGWNKNYALVGRQEGECHIS